MKNIVRSLFAGLVNGLACASLVLAPLVPVLAQTSALIPNAEQTFLDANGDPLVGGFVYSYVPNTTTPKTTWQDQNEAVANANPVVLDSAGRAKIFGQGNYRQIVKDALGTTIWDGFTSAYGSAVPSGATGTDTAPIATVMPFAGFVVPTNWVLAYGQTLARATYPDLLSALTVTATSATCTSASPNVGGWTNTALFVIGAPVEATCLPTGSVISSIVDSNTVAVSHNASATATVSATVFPWGNGDGVNTFNVPDLRGRTFAGADAMGGSAASRLTSTYFGMSAGPVGAAGGAQSNTATTTIAQANLPNVNFALGGTHITITDPGHTHTVEAVPARASVVQSGSNNGGAAADTAITSSSSTTGISAAIDAGHAASGGSGTDAVSAGLSVIQPTLTVNYIIKIKANTTGAGGVVSLGGMFGDILCGGGLTCASQTISVAPGTGLSIGGGLLNITSTIAAGGPTGSATVAPIITYNAQGQLTAVSSATITPAFSSLTGQIAIGQIANGSITSAKLVGTDIATVGTLTSGATGAGFTLALGTSTLTGIVPSANISGAYPNISGLGAVISGSLSGVLVTGLPTCTNATDACPKSYIDAVGSSIIFHPSVIVATAAVALPTVTYANGASGVGATLIATAFGKLTIDGHDVVNGERVLIKDQVAGLQNGVYTQTTLGTGGAAFVLTRATDSNTPGVGPALLGYGNNYLVTLGTVNIGSSWVITTANPITIGTTAISFAQSFSSIVYSTDATLTLTGSVFGLNVPVTVPSGGTGLTVGTSGGVPYFASTTTMGSSAALATNGFVLGGGAGGAPTSTARPTAGQLCFGQSSGACTMAVLSGNVVNDASGVATIQAGVVVNSMVNASAAVAATKLNFTAPGTGGVSTTLQNTLKLALWAHQYGAVCDGSTDDHTAFQNMINEAEALGATANFVGICRINSTLTASGNLTLQGTGYGNSQIYGPANTIMLHFTGAQLIARDFYLKATDQQPCGGTVSSGVPAIYVDSPTGITVIDSIYTDCVIAIRYKDASGCHVNRSNVAQIPPGEFGIVLDQGYNGDCEISGTGLGGANAAGGVFCAKCPGMRFVNNKVNGSMMDNGFLMLIPDGFSDGDLFISANSFEGISGNGVQIQTTGSGQFGTVVISGNEIVGDNIGIFIPTGGAGSWLKGLTITGNLIAAGGAGLSVDTASIINIGGNSIICGSGATVPLAMGSGNNLAIYGPNIAGPTCAASVLAGTNTTHIGP